MAAAVCLCLRPVFHRGVQPPVAGLPVVEPYHSAADAGFLLARQRARPGAVVHRRPLRPPAGQPPRNDLQRHLSVLIGAPLNGEYRLKEGKPMWEKQGRQNKGLGVAVLATVAALLGAALLTLPSLADSVGPAENVEG